VFGEEEEGGGQDGGGGAYVEGVVGVAACSYYVALWGREKGVLVGLGKIGVVMSECDRGRGE